MLAIQSSIQSEREKLAKLTWAKKSWMTRMTEWLRKDERRNFESRGGGSVVDYFLIEGGDPVRGRTLGMSDLTKCAVPVPRIPVRNISATIHITEAEIEDAKRNGAGSFLQGFLDSDLVLAERFNEELCKLGSFANRGTITGIHSSK